MPKSFSGVRTRSILYHRAKFNCVRISPAAGILMGPLSQGEAQAKYGIFKVRSALLLFIPLDVIIIHHHHE